MKKTSLFIVGVARAGTSSWYDYLKQHPEVFMSEEQRPNYFGEHPNINSKYFNTKEKYMYLFKGVTNEKVIGEASHIFGSEIAPKQIKKFNPKSKIIIILRNPFDVLRSHIDGLRLGKIDEKLFFLTFKELIYSHNIKRWLNIFGKKNVYLMIFEEFIKNPKEEYKKVCDFLGIDNTFKPNITKISFSYNVKYPFYMKFMFYIYNKIPFMIRLKMKEILGKHKKRVQEVYRKKDNHTKKKTIINDYDKKVIQKAFFLKEIEKTEKLINRKLDIWKY